MSYSDQELQGLANTYEKMMSNEKIRPQLLKLIKEQFPERQIPEVDARNALDNRLTEELKGRDEKLEKLEKELLEERLHRQIDSQRSLLKSQYGFSDEDITAVEKLMVDNPGINYEFAAKHFDSTRKALRPSNRSTSPLRGGDTSNWRDELRKKDSEIKKNFDQWQDPVFTAAYKEAFGS